MSIRYPLRDKQLDPPAGYCTKCGGEIYDPHNMSGLCAWCEDEQEEAEEDERQRRRARRRCQMVHEGDSDI